MSHSFSKILLHIVFATKNRAHLIPESQLLELHAYISQSIRELGGNCYKVGGITNHVHIAMDCPRTISISKVMENIKSSSSKWLKQGDGGIPNFKWQPGYGAFSLGESQLLTLIRYIENQQKHHKSHSFENEIETISSKYNIPQKEV